MINGEWSIIHKLLLKCSVNKKGNITKWQFTIDSLLNNMLIKYYIITHHDHHENLRSKLVAPI